MSDFGLVVSIGGVVTVMFLALWGRERSRATWFWAWSWVLIFASAVLVYWPDQGPWLRAGASGLGALFALFMLLGAHHFVARPVPVWLPVLGVAFAALRAGFQVVDEAWLAYVAILLVEAPALVWAGLLVWTHARAHDAGSAERVLGPAILLMGALDFADATLRIEGSRGDALLVLWPMLALTTALLQLLAVTDRGRLRERELGREVQRARRMEILGRMAGGIAHDFNNQLTAILGNCRIAMEDLPEASGTREALRDVEQAAEHCAELTQSLLDFGRQSPPEPVPVEAERAFQDAIRGLRASLPDVRIEVSVAAGTPALLADPTQLQRVLANLLVNARDALPGSAGTIWISAQRRKDPRAWNGQRSWVEVEIRDEGAGMDDHTLERSLEPFFTTKSSGRGTGLGLAIVYGITEAHGGRVEIASRPGAGTRVTLYWPATDALPVPQDRGTEAPPVGAAGQVVLLAEDEASVRRLASTALTRAGFQVIEAEDGQEAVDLFESHREKIALVIFDLWMPRRSGLEALALVRQMRAGVPAIATTGNPEAEGGLPADVTVLPKPFTPADLIDRALDAVGMASGAASAQPSAN